MRRTCRAWAWGCVAATAVAAGGCGQPGGSANKPLPPWLRGTMSEPSPRERIIRAEQAVAEARRRAERARVEATPSALALARAERELAAAEAELDAAMTAVLLEPRSRGPDGPVSSGADPMDPIDPATQPSGDPVEPPTSRRSGDPVPPDDEGAPTTRPAGQGG